MTAATLRVHLRELSPVSCAIVYHDDRDPEGFQTLQEVFRIADPDELAEAVWSCAVTDAHTREPAARTYHLVVHSPDDGTRDVPFSVELPP